MPLNQALLPELDHEMAGTRKTLERVPDDKLAWKPHEKSMSMGDLAAHLAEMPSWASVTLDQDSFDINPPGGHTFDRRVDPKTWQPENTREQRDSWNRVWTFLDWNLDPFHDAATSPVSSK